MEGNSIKTFQNLCKIFEMRIKLDNAKGIDVSEEVVDNYEKYAQKIDSYYNEEFQKELKNLISPKDTLEEEKLRLERLIDLLSDRLEKRSILEESFHQTTGKYIKSLQLIVSETELNSKKERLNLITRYLDTTKEIESIEDSVIKLKNDLEEEKTKKEEYIKKNKILEDELYSSFVTSISCDDYYSGIEEEKIIDILNDVCKKASDNKETLDITRESVESLLSSGMDDEYEAYIEEANKNYSLWKEREIILKIYKLVVNFEDDFKDILAKRETINNLFEERKAINIGSDILLPFENLMTEQEKILNNEKEIFSNIANYTSRIEFKEERLRKLEEVTKEPEILAILSEYNLIDEYKEDDAEDSNVSMVPFNNVIEEEKIETIEYNPYEVISVEDYPITLNVGLAKLKGSSVRDKVNKKLNGESVILPGLEDKQEKSIEDSNILDTNIIEPIIPDTPVEDDNKPEEVEINKFENVFTNLENNDNEVNNLFWIPVSEPKNDVVNEFPNVDFHIPVTDENTNNINISEGNLNFPEVNN